MRTGEVFALTWDDVDFEKRTIRVNKTVYCKIKDNKGRWFLGTTKTEGSSRIIYMSDTLYRSLSKFKEYQNINRKLYKSKCKYYYLEQVKNKYGKLNVYIYSDLDEIKRRLKSNNKSHIIDNLDFYLNEIDLIGIDYKIYNRNINDYFKNIDKIINDIEGDNI